MLVGLGCATTATYFASPAVYYSTDELPERCELIGPVNQTMVIPEDSRDQYVPLGELDDRVVRQAKAQALEVGGDALLVRHILHADYTGLRAFEITCLCEAYRCE